MLLKLTVHAQIRLHERGFSIDNLKKAIKNPDKKENFEDGCIKASKKLKDGTILQIVYKKDGFRDKKDQYIVITAYFIRPKSKQ
jgi:hypothetical protein